MMMAACLHADYDGTSVWVQDSGECIARFGRVAFEVQPARGSGREPLLVVGGGLDGWQAFVEAVWAEHAFRLPVAATPVKFHEALGILPEIHAHAFIVPLRCLTEFYDPYRVDFWGRVQVTREAVAEAIADGRLEPAFLPMLMRDLQPPGWDARRIAYLVLNPDRTPLNVEVVATDGTFTLEDGFHRLSAGMFRGDPDIAIELSGYVDAYDVFFADRVPIYPPHDAESQAGPSGP